MRRSIERLVQLDDFWARRIIRWAAILCALGGFWMMARQIYEAGHNRTVNASTMFWGVLLIAFGLGILQKADVSGTISDVTTGIARVRLAILGRREGDPKVVEAPVDVRVTETRETRTDEQPTDPEAEARAQERADDRG